jgi:CBS domain-containing protein
LPVLTDDGDLCGIITQRDLFRGALLRALGFGSRAEDQMLRKVVVKEAMTEDPLTVAPDTPLRDAARQMIEQKVGCLPVVEGDKLVGILTEGDFARFVSRG